jgi:hypothetical protein
MTAAPGFDTLGWFPEGEVYYNYNVTAAPAGCPVMGSPCSIFTVEGQSDLDNDGTLNTWGYVHAAPGAVAGIASASGVCVASGVFNGLTQAQHLLNTTGPCRATDGQKVF